VKLTAFISLDCTTGGVRRYMRAPNNKPRETGRMQFDDWQLFSADPAVDWDGVAAVLQRFRAAYQPPEPPAPRPTPPLRTAQRAAA
jgi:hypothetical protein